MGFVKIRKTNSIRFFFSAFDKEQTFSLFFWPQKKLNLRNQTKATQSKQIKLKLRNPYKEKSTNPYKRNQAANGDKRKPHTPLN
jgi:hypothetical protein